MILKKNCIIARKKFSKLVVNESITERFHCTLWPKFFERFLSFNKQYLCTVTSRLFTHIVSTEKMRKDKRDRKDTRGTKYTYYNGCFFDIASR